MHLSFKWTESLQCSFYSLLYSFLYYYSLLSALSCNDENSIINKYMLRYFLQMFKDFILFSQQDHKGLQCWMRLQRSDYHDLHWPDGVSSQKYNYTLSLDWYTFTGAQPTEFYVSNPFSFILECCIQKCECYKLVSVTIYWSKLAFS